MTVDFWYHVDATHGSFNAMKSSAAAEHALSAPGTILSVYLNNAGTEALVKVRTEDGSFSPGWEAAPFVLRKFTKDDHQEAQAMMYTPDWEREPPP